MNGGDPEQFRTISVFSALLFMILLFVAFVFAVTRMIQKVKSDNWHKGVSQLHSGLKKNAKKSIIFNFIIFYMVRFGVALVFAASQVFSTKI